MSLLKSSSLLAQSVRRIASSAAKNNKIQHSPVDPKFRALQEKFQVNDGVLIHVKGGFTDQVLYRGTVALTLVGCALVLKLIYTLGFPKKQ